MSYNHEYRIRSIKKFPSISIHDPNGDSYNSYNDYICYIKADVTTTKVGVSSDQFTHKDLNWDWATHEISEQVPENFIGFESLTKADYVNMLKGTVYPHIEEVMERNWESQYGVPTSDFVGNPFNVDTFNENGEDIIDNPATPDPEDS